MIHWIHGLVWGPALLGLLLFTGLFFTVEAKGFQIRGFFTWWQATVGSLFAAEEDEGADGSRGSLRPGSGDVRRYGGNSRLGSGDVRWDGGSPRPRSRDVRQDDRRARPENGDIKQNGGSMRRNSGEPRQNKDRQEEGSNSVNKIQAACTALAATIGTGNIAGVASALTAGGPGAVFWMWVSAALGMMTAYAETNLGIVYRYRDSGGKWICGPMVYLARGLRCPRLSLTYGIFCLLASLGMGSMVQSNAASQTICYLTGFSPVICAVFITGLVVFVAWGGTGRVMGVAERLVPVSAGIYMVFSIAVLVICRRQVPEAFGEIFRCALLPRSVLGGVGGYGISRSFRYGIARGVFSNEAGLGSLAGLHGATEDTTPQEQGMWAMFEVFLDTIVICTMTALVILCVTGGRQGLACGSHDGAVLTAWCFRQVLGDAGEYLISGSMIVFAFATMIAWYYLGRQTLGGVLEWMRERWELSGKACTRLETVYLILFGYAVFLGCVSSLTAVWELSDIWNGLMAFPNILALLILHREVRYPVAHRGRGDFDKSWHRDWT